jgi:hypothetical protein
MQFSCPATGTEFRPDDGPSGGAIQSSGNTIFWVDAPGLATYFPQPSFGCSIPAFGGLVDSATYAANFSVKYTNKVTGISRTIRHYVVLRVTPGAILSKTLSKADYGKIELNF